MTKRPDEKHLRDDLQEKVKSRQQGESKEERRIREALEREAVETERRERERDFSKKRFMPVQRHKPRRPPPGYKDPHEVLRHVMVPAKPREERRQEIKALMNCIAFEPIRPPVDLPIPAKRSQPTPIEMDNSLSSDTTSDMTDVTPRSSSSGCSSMSKRSDKNPDDEEEDEDEVSSQRRYRTTTRSRSEGRSRTAGDEKKPALKGVKISCLGSDVNSNHETETEELRYLQEAFEDFEIDEETSDFATSIISGLSEERRVKSGRKNMSFTNEQLREIERVNLILLKKIMAHRKPKVPVNTQIPHRKTSSAINRAKTEKIIEKENQILLKKLQNVKGTTTHSKKTSSTSPVHS